MVYKARHTGELLDKLVKASGMNVTLVTKKAGYSRGMYYTHIKDKDLAPSIFAKYSRVIGHDPLEEFPDLAVLQKTVKMENPKNMQVALQQIEYWKNKYIDMVEKYNACLEKQNPPNKKSYRKS